MNNDHCNKHRLKRLMQYHEKTLSILLHYLVDSLETTYQRGRFNLGVLHLISSVPGLVQAGLYTYLSVSSV